MSSIFYKLFEIFYIKISLIDCKTVHKSKENVRFKSFFDREKTDN